MRNAIKLPVPDPAEVVAPVAARSDTLRRGKPSLRSRRDVISVYAEVAIHFFSGRAAAKEDVAAAKKCAFHRFSLS